MKKGLTGTREWAGKNINIQLGCEHGCRYCYARYNDVKRFRRCGAEDWFRPVIDNQKVDKDYLKYPDQPVMFPSRHDITPANINGCMVVIRRLLDAGNQLLIVSKPHFECISLMCETFKQYRRLITFRFTIGSTDDNVLAFWEPNTPKFSERWACLEYAYNAGYATSVSCEPYLDAYPQYVYDMCRAYLTDSFWLGLLRNFDQRVDLSDVTAEQMEKYVNPLKALQQKQIVLEYYKLLKDKPYIKFKDSVRKVIDQ